MILGDAISAEWFKLTRNRATLVWAFGLTPAATLVVGIANETLARMAGAIIAPANPLKTAMDGIAAPASIIVQLLLIVGAAVMFAGEYRWQTWRAIVPRSSRLALMGGKFFVFAAMAAASIFLCGVAGWLVGLFEAGVLGVPVAEVKAGGAEIAAALALGFAASLAQALVAGTLVAVMAVMGRSLLAATIGPFLVLVGCEVAAARLSLVDAPAWAAVLPNLASRSLREQALHVLGDVDAVGLHLVGPGTLALLVLIAAAGLIAPLVFQRQDLASE
jgi:ABC-2 type transport system permease protein